MNKWLALVCIVQGALDLLTTHYWPLGVFCALAWAFSAFNLLRMMMLDRRTAAWQAGIRWIHGQRALERRQSV